MYIPPYSLHAQYLSICKLLLGEQYTIRSSVTWHGLKIWNLVFTMQHIYNTKHFKRFIVKLYAILFIMHAFMCSMGQACIICCIYICSYSIPYNGNSSRKKMFANFANLRVFANIFLLNFPFFSFIYSCFEVKV